jgi:hypothetical protein
MKLDMRTRTGPINDLARKLYASFDFVETGEIGPLAIYREQDYMNLNRHIPESMLNEAAAMGAADCCLKLHCRTDWAASASYWMRLYARNYRG